MGVAALKNPSSIWELLVKMLDAIQALFGSCCVVLEENSGKDKDIRKESAQMWTKRAVRRGVVPSKPDTKATTPSAVFLSPRREFVRLT